MRYIRAALFIVGFALLICGFLATIEKHYRPDGILSILPASLLPLPHQLYVGHEIFAYLNFQGIVAVYVIPGALLVAVASLITARKAGAD